MLVRNIPFHLRTTVESLKMPIFIEVDGDDLRAPPNLAMGDTLMVLGLLRNLARPMRLHMEGSFAHLAHSSPLVRDMVTPPEPFKKLAVRSLPVSRYGRRVSWVTDIFREVKFPVLPVDKIKANHVLVHSQYYNLSREDDRPGYTIPADHSPALRGLLSAHKPTVVIFPLNQGRGQNNWQDSQWWVRLTQLLRPAHHVVAVGTDDYGELTDEVDEFLRSDDPSSTLPDLAWLFQSAAGYIGRDGGLSHLASAVSRGCVVVWDAMTSYRCWASHSGHHLLMSNPYGHRYPQTHRLTVEDLKRHFTRFSLPAPDGAMRNIELPQEGYEDKAAEYFGSFDNFARTILTQLEADEDRAGVERWVQNAAHKERFYQESVEFAHKALTGQLKKGANWVAPLVP